MTRRVDYSLRWPLLLMLLALLWLLSGAPLAAPEWAEIPAQWGRLFRQMPRRMGLLLARWLP